MPLVAIKHLVLPAAGAAGGQQQQGQQQEPREVMLKAWQDLVTLRLLLAVKQQQGRGEQRVARWLGQQQQQGGGGVRFVIETAGLQPCWRAISQSQCVICPWPLVESLKRVRAYDGTGRPRLRPARGGGGGGGGGRGPSARS